MGYSGAIKRTSSKRPVIKDVNTAPCLVITVQPVILETSPNCPRCLQYNANTAQKVFQLKIINHVVGFLRLEYTHECCQYRTVRICEERIIRFQL
jgi:hypothetical protein